VANNMAYGTFQPFRTNSYVPAMKYSSEVAFNGMTRVNFGAEAAAAATTYLSAQSINAAGEADLTGIAPMSAPFGRTISVVASGAATSAVSIYGFDYLGQPIMETKTLNGAVAVPGVKAFKWLTRVTWALTSSTTIDLGTGLRLGLPFKAIRCGWETANGVLATAGTLLAAVLTDPQTAITADPRGLYTPTTTLSTATTITAAFEMINDVTASNGGLHGIRHYTA